jgi:pimeloyl-ACP methyl ester carboxylesterase
VTGAKPFLPEFEERFADVKGVRVRYFVGGAGSPLVLVHGLGGAAANWTMLAPALARRRRVVIPELPGHGGSAPLAATPALDAFADRVGLVAEREGCLPAPLVGHSMGGLVSLRLALRRPEAVTGVVLAASAGIRSSTRFAEAALHVLAFVQPGRRIAPFRRRVARTPWLRRLAFGYWGAADPRALTPHAAEAFLVGPALHTDVASAARALVLDDPRPDLDRVHCPCLVLWGAADNQVPVDDAFEYARRLRAPLRIVPGCGHLLVGERPDACLDAIESFLDRIGELDELPAQAEALG